MEYKINYEYNLNKPSTEKVLIIKKQHYPHKKRYNGTKAQYQVLGMASVIHFIMCKASF